MNLNSDLQELLTSPVMSFVLSTLQLVAVALLVIFIVSIIRSSIRPNNFPPGPLSLPLVGYIPFLDVRNLGVSFDRLSKRYGDIFSVFLGRSPVVVISNYEMLKDAFGREEFSGRPTIYSGTFFQKGKSGVSTTEGPHWKEQRKFFHEKMLDLSRGKGSKGFQDIVMDEIHDIKMEVAKKVGEPTTISYEINVSVINILWTIASGRRLHSQQQEFQSVYECIDKLTQFMSRAAIMSFMPFLARIVPERISKMEKGRYHRDRFLAISKKWIREHKEEYRGNRIGDFQDAYLAKIEAKEESFTEDGLGAVLREMFVIGAEVQSVTLRWAIRIISVHRDVQRKIQDEIDDVIGKDNDVVWDDKEKLPYTRAAVAEVQRYSDIVPTGIGHKTMCDVQFHGYLLPKGTHVLANLNACHQSKKHWRHPKEYMPEHFLDDDGKFIENHEGFIPYGVGMRRCPGEEIAEMEMFLILANLLKSFSFRTPHGDNKVIGTQFEAGTGFIRNPKPFKVIIQSRD